MTIYFLLLNVIFPTFRIFLALFIKQVLSQSFVQLKAYFAQGGGNLLLRGSYDIF